MTYRERLKKEHPDDVNERFTGGCKGCPSDYGYGKFDFCYAVDVAFGHSDDINCSKCWDMEDENDAE